MPRKKQKAPDPKQRIKPELREQWRSAMKLAYTGKLHWLHTLITKSGYLGALTSFTASQTARFFDVRPQAVGLWHKVNGCPRHPDGNYDLTQVILWRVDHLAEKKANAAAQNLREPGESHIDALRREQTRREKRRNDVEESKLINAIEMESQLTEAARIFRERAEAIERAHGKEVGDAIRDMISEAENAWKIRKTA